MDLKRLEIVPNSEFNIVIKPDDIDKKGYADAHIDTIKFHSKNMGIPCEAVLDRWREGSPEKNAFEYFDTYIKKQAGTILPVAGGQNVRDYDLPIYSRCIEKYKIPYRFFKRDKIELLDFFSHWFMYAKKPPKNYKLDTIREKFGMSLEGAHDALVDVRDTAHLLIRFLKLQKVLVEKVKELNE